METCITQALPYQGEIRIFAGNFAPPGWAFCDGQLLPLAEHETLFQLLGTTYGGDGQETFALPNLRGRSAMHKGQGHSIGESGIVGFKGGFVSEEKGRRVESIGYLATNFIISLCGTYPHPELGDGSPAFFDGPSAGAPFLGQLKIFSFDFAPKGWAECNGQLLSIREHTALFSILGTTYGGDGRITFVLPDLRGTIPINAGSPIVLDDYLVAKYAGSETTFALPDWLVDAGRPSGVDDYPVGKYAGSESVVASDSRSTEVSVAFSVVNLCIALQGIFPPRA